MGVVGFGVDIQGPGFRVLVWIVGIYVVLDCTHSADKSSALLLHESKPASTNIFVYTVPEHAGVKGTFTDRISLQSGQKWPGK